MNGFGQDPFRIYSSRLPSGVPQVARTELPKRSMAGLRSSLGYKQTDIEGRQRMERLVSMGLPSTMDISQVRLEGIGTGGVRGYSAPSPLPFGSYGGDGYGFGMTEEQRRKREVAAAQRQAARTSPAGGPQPAQGTANIAQEIAPTLGETPSTYSGSAFSGTAYTPSAGNMGMGAYRPPTTTPQATSIAGGIGPAPLAAPLPRLSFPTREDEILNPYRLSNY